MVKTVTYKECTCDACGIKGHIEVQYDMPEEWGWIRLRRPGDRTLIDLHLCKNCGDKAVSLLDGLDEVAQ